MAGNRNIDGGRPGLERRALAAACALVIIGLAGCASTPVVETPYVGVFTGEFVDGMPLYRFPTIEVVGSRRAGNGELGGAD